LRTSRTAAVITAAFLLVSCGFVSFEGIAVTSYPGFKDQVIAAGEAITVDFSIPPDRLSAERLLRVTTPEGAASGDFTWSGNRVSFTPRPGLPLGRRILLSFSGTLEAADGRTFSVNVQVPFFVGTAALPPRLTDHSPADAAIVGTNEPIVLTFSERIDANSFALNFSLSPSLEYDLQWNAGGTIVTVSPRVQWSALVLYTWEVGAETKSAAGVLIDDSNEGTFLVQQDGTAPSITRTQPATFQNGAFTPVDSPLSAALQKRDCILLTFSEDVPLDSLSAAFSLNPSVQGYFARISAGLFAYVPQSDYVMNRTYCLRISTDLEDLSGNRIAAEYAEWFVPGIPVQAVTQIIASGVPPVTILAFNSPTAVDVILDDIPGDEELPFTIDFQEPFADNECKARVPGAIRCEKFFPNTGSDPSLMSVSWTGDYRLTVTFSGLVKSTLPILNYYKLIIPGGASGIPNGSGSFLEEDVWVLIIAR
jgi:hypothetical protein